MYDKDLDFIEINKKGGGMPSFLEYCAAAFLREFQGTSLAWLMRFIGMNNVEL